MGRAFTVATLADYWDCSEGVVRKLIAEDRLHPFYLGTAIRIRPEEVERFECQTTRSNASTADSPSSTETTKENADASVYPRPIGSEDSTFYE